MKTPRSFSPTPEFRQIAFRSRTTQGFVWKTGNPERAAHNLAERDRMFTTRLQEETERLELRTIQVDTTITEAGLDRQVTKAFRL